MKNSLILKWLSVFIGVAVGLLTAEAFLRVAFSERYELSTSKESYLKKDAYLGWRNRPESSTWVLTPEFQIRKDFNQFGLRNEDIEAKPAPETFRVLVLGDDFAEGAAVGKEDLFTTILENRLRQKAFAGGLGPIEVLNAGVQNYSTDQELIYYLQEGRDFQPQAVVLMFNFNDLAENLVAEGKPKFELRQGQLRRQKLKVSVPKSLAQKEIPVPNLWAWENFYSYRFLLNLRRDSWREYAVHRGFDTQDGLDHVADNEKAWELTTALLKKFKASVKRQGSRFVLFAIPPRSLFTDLDSHSLAQRQKDLKALGRMGRICRELALECLNPADVFLKKNAFSRKAFGSGIYFDLDGHWNLRGNVAAAEVLEKWILKKYPEIFN